MPRCTPRCRCNTPRWGPEPGAPACWPGQRSPISVAFNLPGIKELNFDAATIAKIFSGAITSWQDPAIKALNPSVDLPDVPLTAVVRSDDSGTTENFTEYLHAAAPEHWTHDPSGSWPGGLASEQAQGNSGVVTTVSRTAGAVTYADDSLVDATLGKGTLKVGDSFVPVSGKAAAIAVGASQRVPGRHGNDIALELDRTTTKPGAYPLVLVSYFIVCSGYSDAAAISRFLTYGFRGALSKPFTRRELADALGKALGEDQQN